MEGAFLWQKETNTLTEHSHYGGGAGEVCLWWNLADQPYNALNSGET